MLDKLKSSLGFFESSKCIIKVAAPIDGESVPVSEVNDPTFSGEMIGKGVAIRPLSGLLTSPVNGTLTQMFDTRHALCITSDDGAELLIHIGLDTVKLQGKHFRALASTGDSIKKGDRLVEFDKEDISSLGYDTITIIVVCNSSDYKEFSALTGFCVNTGEDLITLSK